MRISDEPTPATTLSLQIDDMGHGVQMVSSGIVVLGNQLTESGVLQTATSRWLAGWLAGLDTQTNKSVDAKLMRRNSIDERVAAKRTHVSARVRASQTG